MLWFINAHLYNTNVGDFSNETVDFIFNRNVMINESIIIENCQKSQGVISDETIIANQTKQVEKHIPEIIKLSFEQFTRTVLLAQSEVTAFLKARDNERGKLLEYLTNSEIFAKIPYIR